MNSQIVALDAQFASLDRRRRELLDKVDDDGLFWTPVSDGPTLVSVSVGGSVLRSAAMVEQAFLGITRRLWDDPFEWTLPEKLSSKAAIIEYLNEVEAVRKRGFAFFKSDNDLSKCIPAPQTVKPLATVLRESIAHAETYLERGEAVAKQRRTWLH
jgi:hypothetical protein